MRPAAVGYQCPECVAEARRTAPRRRLRLQFFLGRPGSITTLLLGVNILVFLIELATGAAGGIWSGGSPQKLVDMGALYAPAVAQGHQYWRLITMMFLHVSMLHILFNMYALYLFGFLMESALGRLRYLTIYFVCGFLAGVTSFLYSTPGVPAAGASGAIFGLLGAWTVYTFRRRDTAFGAANFRWALTLIGLNAVITLSIGSIDKYAHIGGLISGVVAGVLAERIGPARLRTLIQVGGFTAMVVVGVALTAFRVSALS
jgi:membrane associated rhomboid family serine protease